MFEELAALFVCIALIVGGGLFIIPFIALHRTRRIDEILARLRSVESQLERLRPPPPLPPEITLQDADLEPAPGKPRRIVARPPPVAASPEWSAIDWETWLGARGLGWAAIILLLFATAFFFRELFERNLIGPLGRVSIGLAAGCLACFAGYRQHRKGWPITCQMLTAGGVVLVYLSVFASFGYYRLLSSDAAGVFLVIVVVEAFALAALYEAPTIAAMAIIGGLLNPILLRADTDRYVSLFTYLAILNAGVAGLLLVRRWRVLSLLAIGGTNLIFWMWYEQNYHPTKLTAALVLHGSLAAIWLVHQILGPMTRFAHLDIEDAPRMFLQAIFLATAGYVLLDDRIPQWMGALALGVAILHTAMTWLALRRRPDDPPHAMCEWSLAMGFLATVLLLQADAPWVAVCWAVQGLALWLFSVKIHNTPLRFMGFAFFTLASFRFLFRQILEGDPHPHPFWPILNTFAISGLGVAACFLIASAIARRLKSDPDSAEFLMARVLGFAGLFFIWVIISVEAYEYFQVQRNVNDPAVRALLQPAEVERNREDYQAFLAHRDVRLAKSSEVAVSIVWGLYAIGMLTLGLRLPSRPLRWSALLLFGVTLLKVMVRDMANLPGLYRVAAFFGLSVMMGAAAWGYQKVKISLLADDEENRNASPI